MLEDALRREQEAAAEREGEGDAMTSNSGGAKATITITDLPFTASSTVVPIREEFRVRRFCFFHHDARAFTTSVSHCISLRLLYQGTGSE